MNDRQNIVTLLFQRQLNSRWNETGFLKSLFKSSNRKHSLSLCKQNTNGMITFDGNLYFSSYKEWFQGCFFENNKPHMLKLNLKNTSRFSYQRIKGTLRYQCSKTKLNDIFGLENNHYVESLFVLTSLSYLSQYILCNGEWKIHQTIFLSTKYNFEQIDHDVELESFYVKSKHLPTQQVTPDVVYCFTLFNVAPLEFVGSFVLKKSVFGSVKEAYIRYALLVMLVKNIYYVFSLEEIIDKYTKHSYKIGEILSTENTQLLYNSSNDTDVQACIGKCPWGFPLTIDIHEIPTILYKFSSEDKTQIGEFSFGGYPWACLVNKRFSADFVIYSLSNNEKLANFNEEKEAIDNIINIDENHSFYHSDNSGRILGVTADKIRCFRLKNVPSPSSSSSSLYINNGLSNDFTLSFNNNNATTQQQQPRYSRYGRSISRLTSVTCTLPSQVVHAIDYHEVCDALAVLFTEHNCYFVGFYDNQDGRLLRKFRLDEHVAEDDDHVWSLFLNELVVICVLRYVGRSNSRNKCFIYQLVTNDQF